MRGLKNVFDWYRGVSVPLTDWVDDEGYYWPADAFLDPTFRGWPTPSVCHVEDL